MTSGRARLRAALSTLGLLTAVWSAILVPTHGLSFTLLGLRISSRTARNPFIVALVLLALALLIAPAGARLRTVAADLLHPVRRAGRALLALARTIDAAFIRLARPPAATACALLLVILTLGVSWTRGSYVAGGADSYGYVSEAHLFATGRLRLELPLAHAFLHVPARGLTPLGYKALEDRSESLVPTYAPGLPLTMALFERVGGPDAVYAVMPLLAALAVWCSYRIGLQIAGPGVGVVAALLMFATPAFLFQLMFAPMSDIPAAGWWSLALALLLRPPRPWSAVGAGSAAGLAILTRPNLLLVVVMLGGYLLWRIWRDPARRRTHVATFAWFSAPVVAACLGVAVLNDTWYGSPLRSGYSGDLFGFGFWWTNIRHFSAWLTESQTPLLFLGFAAPFVVRWLPGPPPIARQPAAALLVATMLAVFASYLFYTPFEVWWYLRFLLPGFPALAAATALTLAAVSVRFGRLGRAVTVAATVIAVSTAMYYLRGRDGLGEYRYRIIAEWVRDRLPENAIIMTMQHSGSVLHYSGRPIARYDIIARGDYEVALSEMVAAGYHPYLVVDDWEIADVRSRHGAGPHGALDWPPIAHLPLGDVQVFDLAADIDNARAAPARPERIPVPPWIRGH